jgi:hypothetical protein
MPYWMMTYAELIDLFIDRAASIQMVFIREVLQQLKRESARELGLGGCPRIEAVARESLFESVFSNI